MSENVLTVKQEIEVLLRAARETARDRMEYLATLEVSGVSEFHAEVLAELDAIIEAYVSPPEPPVFKVGDYVRLTGSLWNNEPPFPSGTLVQITEVDLHDYSGEKYAYFLDEEGDRWYVVPKGHSEYPEYGGQLVEVDPEIRIGDTVRILPRYTNVIMQSRGSKNQSGVEFVVTQVNRAVQYHPDAGVSNFYVGGDPEGWGIWETYIEKVHK
jgi:hypothetical protein